MRKLATIRKIDNLLPIEGAELGITNAQELLKFVEGASYHHPVREGLVFKRIDGKFSFKAISNLFLLKEKD